MMGKRFTDASKWQDPWFRQLTPTAKVFYLFLLDNVDTAGVWDRDDALFQFLSGCPVEVDAHLEELEGRIVTLSDGKILVPKFVKFQNRTKLSQDCPPHRQILRLLDKHGLVQDASGLIILSKGFAKGKGTQGKGLPNPLGIGKGIGIGKGKGDARGGIPPALDDPAFHEAWESYLEHRRQNKWGKLKQATITAKFKEFVEWGLEATVQALQEAVRQGWRGVFRQTQTGTQKDEDRDYANAADF
jgi:hypothetical protein